MSIEQQRWIASTQSCTVKYHLPAHADALSRAEEGSPARTLCGRLLLGVEVVGRTWVPAESQQCFLCLRAETRAR